MLIIAIFFFSAFIVKILLVTVGMTLLGTPFGLLLLRTMSGVPPTLIFAALPATIPSAQNFGFESSDGCQHICHEIARGRTEADANFKREEIHLERNKLIKERVNLFAVRPNLSTRKGDAAHYFGSFNHL